MSWIAIAVTTSVVSTVAGAAMSIHGQRNAAKAAEQSAEWNADQQRKQAAYEESVAQKNMRRERENNKRELARRRASSARSGLMETGAVSDNLLEASERHQVEIDDIWERAATQANTRRAQANMSIWEGQTTAAAAKTAMWGTAIGAAGSLAQIGMKYGGDEGGEGTFGDANAATNTRNYNASL
jgi:hypothetical protein